MDGSPLSRRQFVAGASSLGAVAVFAPQALAAKLGTVPTLRGGRFDSGLMSGDPTPNGITLWTRVFGVGGKGSVELEIAKEKSFRRVVKRELIGTGADLGHSVKARVTGLDPYEQYYYRFATKTANSPVGRFRTALPADSRQPVRFAFWSCQDYTHGFYNAHALMAREDIDFMVCLGDYIYDETYHTVGGSKTAVRDDTIGRTPDPSYTSVFRAAVSLDDYRKKYALYRSDASLRALQAKVPIIVIWDDHEVQNNYVGKPADGGLPANEGFTQARKKAGYRAFFENQPTYGTGSTKSRIYRQIRFGKTVDLLMLDQRQYRDDQPCGDAVAKPCADFDQPRDFLGRTQMNWVKGKLASSKAAWKVIGNEVMCMPAQVLGGSYYTFDMWHGYPREREELLQHIKAKGIKDVVFVTGDIHTFIAGDVRTQLGAGDTVATEFVGGSITSQNFGETDLDVGGGTTLKGNDASPKTSPAIIDALKGINTWVADADFDTHGYGLVKATTSSFDVQFRRLQTIKRKSTATLPAAPFKWTLRRGQQGIARG
ncbi:MAG: alkaline phosphatase D family protein [Solirubrobacteraceae bacterium]